jgi:hypothetical protein
MVRFREALFEELPGRWRCRALAQPPFMIPEDLVQYLAKILRDHEGTKGGGRWNGSEVAAA